VSEYQTQLFQLYQWFYSSAGSASSHYQSKRQINAFTKCALRETCYWISVEYESLEVGVVSQFVANPRNVVPREIQIAKVLQRLQVFYPCDVRVLKGLCILY